MFSGTDRKYRQRKKSEACMLRFDRKSKNSSQLISGLFLGSAYFPFKFGSNDIQRNTREDMRGKFGDIVVSSGMDGSRRSGLVSFLFLFA